MTKNVLVTGCAGFIGYNLSKTLINQENNIIGIDKTIVKILKIL